MKLIITCYFFLLVSGCLKAQSITEVLNEYNKNSVEYITVQELKKNYKDYTILDTRQKKEYDVSHLPNAIWVGERFDKKNVKNLDKKKPVVVYCTIGVRSENYGEDLLKNEFKIVKNLHGSIFSWQDAGYTLVDSSNKPTTRVHTYSKNWSKYLKTGTKVN